ncbi:uncharacterized protein [Henckelia pumila]|uniref:uncharacterized protein n=1 Tax=Henckelia pumila TaxID=405737 RepID=UPI003C6DCA23
MEIYGKPDASKRRFSWELLRKLFNFPELIGLPWLVGDDFNEICFDNENLGGVNRAPAAMQAFREVLEVCELQDLHCSGEWYTWVNMRERTGLIFERLDRFVGNLEWKLLYPSASVSSLEFYHSDHRPIQISLCPHHSFSGN